MQIHILLLLHMYKVYYIYFYTLYRSTTGEAYVFVTCICAYNSGMLHCMQKVVWYGFQVITTHRII